MLDIGAGDGHVTNQFKEIVKGQITCTEAAPKMIKVLKSQGFNTTTDISGKYDLVSCLNVLDRCDKPISILESMRAVDAKCYIIAIVLPYKGFYHDNTKKLPQLETLIDTYKNWEESVNVLVSGFKDLGFSVEKISRVPYLSEGNYYQKIYSLDTAVFILK